MRCVLLFLAVILLSSCWRYRKDYTPVPQRKVWGSKPIYAAVNTAKQINYIAQKQPLKQAGNIYAKDNFIFQIDIGRGIHVIDNSVTSKADRIGFINVNGCAQIAIKGNYLYTNSYADLVTIDVSDPIHVKEVSRVAEAFPDFRYNYPLAQPEESGYYLCPRYDSVVVGWVKDSIYTMCYKQ